MRHAAILKQGGSTLREEIAMIRLGQPYPLHTDKGGATILFQNICQQMSVEPQALMPICNFVDCRMSEIFNKIFERISISALAKMATNAQRSALLIYQCGRK